ncbi:hypothetical protein DRE_04412 [Drechslerella stenobrocha 248]|uniref:Large ribosomal subunit protein mL59 domain-containing protein n=1 Tax=Drechslerella stenobrocha 248 TaxID=1043628 RepID=W7HQ03_9PEZI|nr:hypothetical protein DRE_04412 [Drechslerella stenobrocha 248]
MAAVQASSTYVTLAKTLPPRLTRFFKRWPPGTAETPQLNPFTTTRNPATGKWQDPIYSLRRQADLCKLARKYGVETLLPPTPKSAASREQRALEVKKVTAKKVKGQIWERQLMAKVEKRKQAMLKMPQLIKEWKLKGHGRGWRDWPK